MKNVVACPYCYTQFNINQVAFICSGSDPAGGTNKCQKGPDGRRLHHFGDSIPQMPVLTRPDGSAALGSRQLTCDHCRARTSFRACPECHMQLPSAMDAESELYAMVGVRRSGKTVMLMALDHELRNSVAQRFSAAISTPNVQESLAGDLRRMWTEMTGPQQILPGQTANRGSVKQVPAVYSWQSNAESRKGSHARIFSFFDNAGEVLTDLRNALDQKYLSVAGGVILILDPFAFPEGLKHAPPNQVDEYRRDNQAPEQVLSTLNDVLRFAHHVKDRKKIPVPIAVVISKIDHFFPQIPENHPLRRPSSADPYFDEGESLSVHDHVASLIADWGGHNVLNFLQANFETYRLFGASALGAVPDYDSGTVGAQGALPFRVAEPLLWLLAHDGFLPRRA